MATIPTSGESETASSSDADLERVGTTLRTIRKLRGVTPNQLANLMGISRSYLYNLELGQRRLTDELLATAADALDVPQMSILRPGTFPIPEPGADDEDDR